MQVSGIISVSVLYSSWGSSQYYNFVVISGMMIALIFIFLHFVRAIEKIDRIPWTLVVSSKLITNTYRFKIN